MKAAREPLRWSELGSDAPPELSSAIRSLGAVRGSALQVAALERRLTAQLAAPTSASSAATWPWIKLGVLLISGALGIFAFSRARHPAHERAPHAARAVSAAPSARTPAPAITVPSAPLAAPEHHETLRAASKPHPSHAAAPAPAKAQPAAEAELVLLQRSQAALDLDPSSALALAEQHAHAYPEGVFAQEREILAMEALLKLRRTPAALARAERFVREYPRSPHSQRVRALLERFRSLAPETTERDRSHSLNTTATSGRDHEPN